MPEVSARGGRRTSICYALAGQLAKAGYDVVDCGPASYDPDDDYPPYCIDTATRVVADPGSLGVVVGGSGNGEQIAANKVKGIRAALCWDVEEARSSRNDDDSNVLCLSSRYTSFEDAEAIVNAWLATPFAGAPRFVRRLRELDKLG